MPGTYIHSKLLSLLWIFCLSGVLVAREASVLDKEETTEEHQGVPALHVRSESPAILTEDRPHPPRPPSLMSMS